AVVELYNSGVLRPRIDSVRPLAQIADAMARFGRGEHRGKVVVEID
ncbi:MAG TPA: zinc-binding dehydrogenase, partial [Rhodoglobus sp.]|nr:zinc-binding dehydrogenase [Rhodoglobus sp.]